MTGIPRFVPAPECRPPARPHRGSTARRGVGSSNRSFLPAAETCEDRRLMSITWQFNLPASLPPVASPQNVTPHQVPAAAWTRNLQDAGSILSSVLPQWNEKITVNVSLVAGGGNGTERAGGAPTQMESVGQVTRGGQTFSVVEPQDIQAARVGGAAGINLTLDPKDLTSIVSVDESPKLTGQTPKTKEDFVSLAIHELIHGLGFIGYRSLAGPSFGTIPGGVMSSFDALTEPMNGLPSSGPLTFDGKRAEAAHGGGPVQLTSVLPANATPQEKTTLSQEAFYHVANFGDGRRPLDNDPMNGLVFPTGRRFTAADLTLDAAMLNDLFHLPTDRVNLVIVADTTSANTAGDLAADLKSFETLATTLLDQDPLSKVDVIAYVSRAGKPQEFGFTPDLNVALKELAGIKLSGQKGPVPATAYNQLVALVHKHQTWSDPLGWPASPTVIAFDDMTPVTIPAF